MPYPPPPGPPDVGEFQAIGKLPAPELPDVTGHGGEFLETDGIVPQWQPVTGVLPDPTGHAGEFLTTPDGVTFSWSAVNALPAMGGHGGEFLTTDGSVASWAPGGAGVNTIGALVSPTANAATIVGTTLALAPADSTHPGVSSIATQQFAGQKVFIDGAVVEVWDIRQFDDTLVPNDQTKDCSLAYYRAYNHIITAGQLNPFSDYMTSPARTGAIYFPEGSWYTSVPLMVTKGMTVYGDGSDRTYINVGPGTAATPTLVQGFSGPVFYGEFPVAPANFSAYVPTVIEYGPSLNGTTPHSIHLHDKMVSIPLHDSYPWSWWLGMMVSSRELGFKFEFELPSQPPAGVYHIIGSEGPSSVMGKPAPDRALCVKLEATGSQSTLHAYLTTDSSWAVGTFHMQSGTTVDVVSSPISVATPIHVELDWDGLNFYFYVDGVLQGSAGATGALFRQPWEGSTIAGPGLAIEPQFDSVACSCYLGCIKFSNQPFHTGAGPFTPDFGPYTADSNTLWLANWDQTDFPMDPAGNFHLPFLMAKAARQTNPSNNGPDTSGTDGTNLISHYIRMPSGTYNSWIRISNLHVFCGTMASGVVNYQCPLAIVDHVAVSFACRAAFQSADGVSFYSANYKCYALAPADYGFLWYGNSIEPYSLGCPIGVQTPYGGIVSTHLSQPNFAQFFTTILGPGNSTQSLFVLEQASNDAEGWTYLRQAAVLGLWQAGGSVVGWNNIFAAVSSNSPPAMLLAGASGSVTLTGDSWQPGFGGGETVGSPCQFVSNPVATVRPHGAVTIINPNGSWGTPEDPRGAVSYVQTLPFSDYPGTVTLVFPEGQTQLKSLSQTDVISNNLAGEFTIRAGTTWGKVNFFNPEPDNNYDVWVVPKGYTGSAPSAGALNPGLISYIGDGEGFIYTTGVDPGGSCVLNFSYMLIRRESPPFYFEEYPTVPDVLSNPFNPTHTDSVPWTIGCTVVPAAGNCFLYDSAQVTEEILNIGTVPNDGHWIELYFNGGASVTPWFTAGLGGTYPLALDPLTQQVISGKRSKLINIYNPGTHNLVMELVTTTSARFYIDGGLCSIFSPVGGMGSAPWLGFPADIYRGQRYDASRPLTRATLRDWKQDFTVLKATTSEQDEGVGIQQEAMFIGDDWTTGDGGASVTGGSWASQLANSKYATYYYWFSAFNKFALNTSFGGPIFNLTDLWQNWGQYRNACNTAVVMAGFHDLLNDFGTPPTTGHSAAVAFADLQNILEGREAYQDFTAPTTNVYAVAYFAPPGPTWGGGVTLTISSVTFSVPFTTDRPTSMANLAIAVNLDATVSLLGTASAVIDSVGNTDLLFTASAPGTSGNGIPFTAGGGGSTYTGFPAANATFAGVDCTLDVNGIQFIANFITDNTTSINTLVGLITASTDPAISGVVTAANVGGKCRITAVTPGVAGNSIQLLSNQINGAYTGAYFNDPLGTSLQGGLNPLLGRVPNIILCTCPPFGTTNAYYTAGKETERQTFNTSIRNWVIANAGAGAVLADVDATVKDGPGTSLNAAYDDGTGLLNTAGHTAVLGLISPLVP